MSTVLITALLHAHSEPTRFVVDGSSNAASGSFRTLEAARDAIRAGKGRGTPKQVFLRAGVHALTRPFELDARDAGSPGAPITYATHPDDLSRGSIARVSGGVRVPPSAFQPVSVPSGASGVLTADLIPLGLNVTSLGAMGCPYPKSKLELFYQGAPMTLARDPNVGTDPLSTWHWVGYENASRVDDLTLSFADVATAKRWSAAMSTAVQQEEEDSPSLWLHGYYKFDWRDTYLRVASIQRNATSGNYTLLRDPKTSPQYPWKSGCRFYAVDNLALLDAPGEYYVSPKGRLYFYPPPSSSATASSSASQLADDVYVSVLSTVLSADGANHTSWTNLTLEVARGDVASLSGSQLSVAGSTVRNGGGACLEIRGTNSKAHVGTQTLAAQTLG